MHGRGCTSRQSSPAVLVSLALSSLLVLRPQVGEVVYHWNNDKTCTLHITGPRFASLRFDPCSRLKPKYRTSKIHYLLLAEVYPAVVALFIYHASASHMSKNYINTSQHNACIIN